MQNLAHEGGPIVRQRPVTLQTILAKDGKAGGCVISLKGRNPTVRSQRSGFLLPKKSVFSRIVGDSHLELEFAGFLDGCEDVVSFAKNYLAVGFKLDYVNADGNISNYYPDFIVKVSERAVFIVETKGWDDLDVPLKMARLKQWCEDINRAQEEVCFDFVFVDEEGFKKYRPHTFAALVKGFREYKD